MYLAFIDDDGDVIILVQGGTNGSTTIVNLGTLGGTAAITAGASFSSAQQVFGDNMIAGTHIMPNTAPFTTSGADSALSRASGTSFTIECYIRWSSLAATSPSATLFDWLGPSSRFASLRLSGSSGALQWINGSNSPTNVATLSSGVTYFCQLTVDGDTYYLDLDGTQVATGSFSSINASGTYSFYAAAINSANSTADTWFATPLRVTRGVARPRGGVPAGAWDLP